MTLRFAYDPDRWVYVPDRFPWNGYRTRESWAATVARLAAAAFGYDAEDEAGLDRVLRALLAYPRLTPSLHRFALLGTPEKSVELVQVVDAPTDPSVADDALLGLPADDATRTPDVTSFTGGLGAGRRSVRFTRSGSLGGEIVASVSWAWRTGSRDVVVTYGTSNLVKLDAVLPLLDAFASSIHPA